MEEKDKDDRTKEDSEYRNRKTKTIGRRRTTEIEREVGRYRTAERMKEVRQDRTAEAGQESTAEVWKECMKEVG